MEAADRSVTLAPAHLSTRCSDFTCAAGAWARPRYRHAAPRSAAQRSAAPCSGGGGTRPVGKWPACCQVLHSQPQVGSSRQRGLRPIRQLRADTQSAAVRCSPPAALGRRAQPQKPPAAALGRLAARRAQLAPRLRLGVGPDLHEAVPLPGQPPPDRAGGALACSRAGGKTASQAGHPGAPGPGRGRAARRRGAPAAWSSPPSARRPATRAGRLAATRCAPQRRGWCARHARHGAAGRIPRTRAP